jgi:GAF domain-containing protein
MALPLIVGEETLGVLDIQSVEANAFSEEDISTLQIIADQLAIAMQNAHLFVEIQEALETAGRAYMDTSQQGWQKLLEGDSDQASIGYIGLSRGDIASAESQLDSFAESTMQTGEITTSEDEQVLYVPIQVRGFTIGIMRLAKQEETQSWSPEEIEDVRKLTDQISSSLESARLYEDAQRRAAKESVISDVTSKIGASVDLKNVLWTAAQELGRTLGDSEILIQFADSPSDGDDHGK